MKLNQLKNKKIVILGFGREGRDVFSFLRKAFPSKIISIADENEKLEDLPKGAVLHLGKNCFDSLKDYQVAIKSPGIPFKKIEPYLSDAQILTTETEIFFDNCKGIIVGVTGTKGKSSTSSLIYKILKDGKKEAYLLGNIGIPVLRYMDKKGIFVYELSSHQLYNLKNSPHIAVFLNVYKEHLDYYKSFKDYYSAKANIFRFQKKNDFLVYNAKNKIVNDLAREAKSKKIDLNSIKDPLIKSSLNQDNIKAALAVSNIFKIPREKALKSIANFKTLNHRLELVGDYQGITFYNDSLSTIPEAAVFAIEHLGKKLHTIILGGFDRGADFADLAEKIKKSGIKEVILFLPSGQRIKEAIGEGVSMHFAKDMAEAVFLCFKNTPQGKICLLSPASPSFGMFKDYSQRGDLFKKLVKEHEL